MTMPLERTRHLIQAGAFLRDLAANMAVPKQVRTYCQPFGHWRQMNWAGSPNELGTSAMHLGSHCFV